MLYHIIMTWIISVNNIDYFYIYHYVLFYYVKFYTFLQTYQYFYVIFTSLLHFKTLGKYAPYPLHRKPAFLPMVIKLMCLFPLSIYHIIITVLLLHYYEEA